MTTSPRPSSFATKTANASKKRDADATLFSWDDLNENIKRLRQQSDRSAEIAAIEAAEVQSLREALQRSEAKSERLRLDYAQELKWTERLQAEADELNRKLSTTQAELTHTRANLDHLETEQTTLKHDLDCAVALSQKFEKTLTDVSEERDQMLAAGRKLKKDLQAANAQCKAAVGERDKALKVITTASALQQDANINLARLAEPAIALGKAMLELREALGLE